MRIQLNLLAGAALIAAPAVAMEAPRAPTGKWVVDFDTAQCIASRDYGTSGKPLLLVLKQPPAGNVVQVAFIRKGGQTRYGEHVKAMLRFDGGEAIPATMIAFDVKERDQRVVLFNMPLDQFQLLRNANSLTIQANQELNETFQLVQIEPLMKILANCVADLRRAWNADDPAAKLKERARGNILGVFRAEDYPGVAVSEMQSGTVDVVLLFDERGQVADCTTIRTSGVPVLDAQTCAVIKQRVRFKPAVGIDGKPARDMYMQRITWRIR